MERGNARQAAYAPSVRSAAGDTGSSTTTWRQAGHGARQCKAGGVCAQRAQRGGGHGLQHHHLEAGKAWSEARQGRRRHYHQAESEQDVCVRLASTERATAPPLNGSKRSSSEAGEAPSPGQMGASSGTRNTARPAERVRSVPWCSESAPSGLETTAMDPALRDPWLPCRSGVRFVDARTCFCARGWRACPCASETSDSPGSWAPSGPAKVHKQMPIPTCSAPPQPAQGQGMVRDTSVGATAEDAAPVGTAPWQRWRALERAPVKVTCPAPPWRQPHARRAPQCRHSGRGGLWPKGAAAWLDPGRTELVACSITRFTALSNEVQAKCQACNGSFSERRRCPCTALLSKASAHTTSRVAGTGHCPPVNTTKGSRSDAGEACSLGQRETRRTAPGARRGWRNARMCLVPKERAHWPGRRRHPHGCRAPGCRARLRSIPSRDRDACADRLASVQTFSLMPWHGQSPVL